MSYLILLRAIVNSGPAADESMQSSPSQHGSAEGLERGLCSAVPMASCSNAEFSQQEGGAGAGLCMSQSGGQNVRAAAAGPSKPTATNSRGITRYRPSKDRCRRMRSSMRYIYYSVAGLVKSVEKCDQIV